MAASSARSTETSPIQRQPQFRVWRVLKQSVVGAAVAAVGFCGWALLYPSRVPAAVGLIVENLTGANPNPIELQRPVAPPQLSAVAQLGKKIFFDPTLSASGRQSCASCHSPEHAYGPANNLAVQLGGPSLSQEGYRPPPSLMYLYRQPNFSIGPDAGDADNAPDLAKIASQAAGVARAQKNAGVAPAAPAMVPQGGMFWDGRADTLQAQASGPLLNPVEMANANIADVMAKLERTSYKDDFVQLFGGHIFENTTLAMSEAMFAVARYQVEEQSFHPYTSKYDAYLAGKAQLTKAELHGLEVFNDEKKGNCASCHISQRSMDGAPPQFSDFGLIAIGVPRNRALPVNRDPHFYDLGACGPERTDLGGRAEFCGIFRTPTLRNVALKKSFFHNGIYHSLDQVVRFYAQRDTNPEKFYPVSKGKVQKFDDLPQRYWANLNTEPPFDRKPGDKPALDEAEIKDVVAFLNTLTDGYKLEDKQGNKPEKTAAAN